MVSPSPVADLVADPNPNGRVGKDLPRLLMAKLSKEGKPKLCSLVPEDQVEDYLKQGWIVIAKDFQEGPRQEPPPKLADLPPLPKLEVEELPRGWSD